MNFSDKIKFQREQNHLTQKELAELVGVSQRAIAAYESSGTIARISTMRKLAHQALARIGVPEKSETFGEEEEQCSE